MARHIIVQPDRSNIAAANALMRGAAQLGQGMESFGNAYRRRKYASKVGELEKGLYDELMGVPVGEEDVFGDLQGNMTKRENFPDYGTPSRKMEPSRERYNEFLDQHKDDNRQLDLNKYNQWLQQNRSQQEQYFPPMRPQQVTRRRPLTQEERTAVIDKYNRKLKVANSYMPRNERVEPFGGEGMTEYERKRLEYLEGRGHRPYKPKISHWRYYGPGGKKSRLYTAYNDAPVHVPKGFSPEGEWKRDEPISKDVDTARKRTQIREEDVRWVDDFNNKPFAKQKLFVGELRKIAAKNGHAIRLVGKAKQEWSGIKIPWDNRRYIIIDPKTKQEVKYDDDSGFDADDYVSKYE
ncbi:MAG: hypothetical protein GY861_01770 [bacterium]|nr:hypothetical protein [bacterium]